MKRNIAAMLLLAAFALSASGCSFALKEYDDTQERKVAAIEQQNKSLTRRVESLRKQVTELNQQMEGISKKVEQLEAEKQRLIKEKEALESRMPSTAPAETITETRRKAVPGASAAEKTAAEQRTREIASKAPAPAKPAEQAKEIKKEQKPSKAASKMEEMLKARGIPLQAPAAKAEAPAAVTDSDVVIKVLSGTGDISDAKRMSRTLADLGYKTNRAALAERANFEGNTVYYAADYKDVAESIKGKLGARTMVKPLTWKSSFKIIVVVGRPPE